MTTDSISTSDSYDEATNRVTTNEARDRLKDTLFSALETGENTLIEAPTSLGKSFTVATTRWRDYPETTGGKPVIHIHQTKKARDNAIQESRKEPGVECNALRGRTDSCPVAKGDYDTEFTTPLGLGPSEWFGWMCDVRNIPFSKAHKQLSHLIDLPCGKHCDGVTQWWDVEYSDEPGYDVLHTTANFAHVHKLIEGANVIFDERPKYGFAFQTPEREQFQHATTNLLEKRSDGEYATLDLRYAVTRNKPQLKAEISEYFEDGVEKEWLFGREESHRLAPAIGRAILDSGEVCEGRYHGQDGRVEVVIEEQDGKIRHVQHTPPLSQARCVIGLDAFPSETRWEINAVGDLARAKVLSSAERRWWRQHERRLVIKQIGDATRSYTQKWKGAGEKRCRAIIQKIRDLHGEAFQSCITPKAIKEDVRRMMEEVGIEEPKTMHYGEQKSRNGFSNEQVGLLVGCIDPGDETIFDWLALRELIAEPKQVVADDGEQKRAPGREFTGPDADIARELLASVRENNLAQAAGRYARNPDDSTSGATVYVWSDAMPRRLVDDTIETTYYSATEKKKQFVDVLKQNPSGCTASVIADKTGSNKSYVINCLEELEQHRKVTKSVGTGYQGATEWQWRGNDIETFVTFDS